MEHTKWIEVDERETDSKHLYFRHVWMYMYSLPGVYVLLVVNNENNNNVFRLVGMGGKQRERKRDSSDEPVRIFTKPKSK